MDTIEAMKNLEAATGRYSQAIGTDSIVVRTDMLDGVGMVIAYASTGEYALESRAAGDGRYTHRVNSEWYGTSQDIPKTFRKARTIAGAVESQDISGLLDAQRAYEAAYEAWRLANV